MKKLVLSLAILGAIFTGCSSDDDNNGNGNDGGNNPSVSELSGAITTNTTLNANTVYTVKGGVFVNDGITLTIPAGTRIEGYAEADAEEPSFIAVKQGGKIIAQGTADKPIVMTSSKANPAPGDWGGLIICGNALTNLGVNVQAEVTGLTYGGTNKADNSGVYSHIIVEYAGALINPSAEFNSVTFYAVGSATKVDNILVYQGSDDGFEWFGGSVGGTNLSAIGCQDDSFDWTEGWDGVVTNLYSDQSSAIAFSSDSRGIEADSNENNPTLAPISNPTLSNVTLIGRNNSAVTSEAGIMLRRGTYAKINNVYISGFKGENSFGINFNGDESRAFFEANPLTNISINDVREGSNMAEGYQANQDATGAGDKATKPTWMNWMKL